MIRARLRPLALNKWGPLVVALSEVLDQIRRSQTERFTLAMYSGNPHPCVTLESISNKIRVSLDLGGISVESMHSQGILLIRTTGFVPDRGGQRVFSRTFSNNYSREVLSKLIVDLCISAGILDEQTYFEFQGGDLARKLAESDAFWHYRTNPNVVCLPGMNWQETFEGNSEPPF